LAKCFVTSLSPHRIERQQYCIETWRKQCLPIVAVQSVGESENLRNHFEGIEFIEVEPKENVYGKPHLPRIFDMIRLTGFDCIFLNSDISIKDTGPQFRGQWIRRSDSELIIGIRKDYLHVGGKKTLTPYGIDAFRISPSMQNAIQDEGFVIGMPGWDYWLPWRINRAGFSICVAKSSLLHPLHEMGWNQEQCNSGRELLAKTLGANPDLLTEFIQRSTGRWGLSRSRNRQSP
jgi:hypothetical protein